MLDHCVANLVARTESQTKSLEDIAKSAGYGETKTVLSRRAFATDERNCILNFFFIHYHLGDGLMKAVISSIRGSGDIEVKFAPIILFTTDLSFEDYLNYIRLGFDDVITLPEKRELIKARLASQVGHDIEYFETSDYFGPDRRRMEIEPPNGVQRSNVPHSHIKYVFRRNPASGTKLLQRIVNLPLNHEKTARPGRNTSENGSWPVRRA
jgi:hypothetical protein